METSQINQKLVTDQIDPIEDHPGLSTFSTIYLVHLFSLVVSAVFDLFLIGYHKNVLIADVSYCILYEANLAWVGNLITTEIPKAVKVLHFSYKRKTR